jgi:DNA-binding transcriptional LysR family regulator
MEKIDKYGDLAIFVKVADSGGFSAAARDLGISTSHASRAIQRLENRVGARLMNRTTRRIVLTEAGHALQERARGLIAELDEAETAVTDHGGTPRGTLRVTMPIHFGVRFVAPLAVEFAQLHPGLSFDLSLNDRLVDVIAEGFDLAVRIGVLADSALIARRLGVTRSLTVASEGYLDRYGTPAHPAELVHHRALVYAHEAGGPTWRFLGLDGEVTVRVNGPFAANNGEALRVAAIAGIGIARLPDAIAVDDVRAGHLTRILADWEHDLPIAAVYPPGRHLSPKVRQFTDFLAERLASAPWLSCPKGRS